jgi:uncharacterized membrane protein
MVGGRFWGLSGPLQAHSEVAADCGWLAGWLGKDWKAGVIEDMVAIGGAVLIVALLP